MSNSDVNDIYCMLYEYFNRDWNKVCLWLHTENGLLGGMTGAYMISIGREKKLADCIKGLLDGNRP